MGCPILAFTFTIANVSFSPFRLIDVTPEEARLGFLHCELSNVSMEEWSFLHSETEAIVYEIGVKN